MHRALDNVHLGMNDLSITLPLLYLQVPQSELSPLTNVFGDRDDAIRSGLTIDGKRYEASMQLSLV